jgi:hypothetical protein
MEHPLITGADELTDQEISDKIQDLQKRYSMAMRMYKQGMAAQIVMAIDSYKAVQTNRLQQQRDDKNSKNLDGKIDIS